MVNSSFSWGNSPAVAKIFSDWYYEYIKQYQTVGVVELFPRDKSKFVFGEALQTLQITSQANIWISQLK
jgi:hypothetical protein